ncbi:MAG TPA: methionyl-tRNA formyltransferase, partial [Acidimicrobiales bacterium]
DIADVVSAGVDLAVVVAYGRIIRPAVLDHVPMVNLHFSELPRWRGAAPVERAILAGDATTGVCVMAVEEGLDTGGVYARRSVKIRRGSTAEQLREQLVDLGTRLLLDTLADGLGEPEPQAGEPTYAEKLTSADLELHWDRPAEELARVVRVGGAWTTFRGRRLKVHQAMPLSDGPGPGAPGELHDDEVTTAEGRLRLREVQPEGRGRIRVDEWRNGARPLPGERLGQPAAASTS